MSLTSPMKSVCILVQSHYETDIRITRKAEALVGAGYQVDVLALRSSFSKSKNYSLGGVSIYTISLGRKRSSLVRYLFEYLAFSLWAFFKLFGLMRRRKYAVIDTNNLPDFLVFAALYARWKGAKVVFDMHEITPEFYMSKYKMDANSWLVRFLKFVERSSMRFADHVLTINEPIQGLLESRGLDASKSTIITNSADEAFFAASAKTSSSGNVPAQGGGFVMMYHGTLTHIYGLDIAIEALGLVHEKMPGAELWILGNGPAKAPLEKLTRKRGLESKVKFFGTVRPQEIPFWLGRCDIGVLATRQDVFLDLSFSSKLSEYIISGKAVISSRLKTIGHYFSGDALAFFEPNQPADLARQMLKLYEDPGRRTELAARAKLEYTPIRWDVMRERYLTLMEELTKDSAAVAQRDHIRSQAPKENLLVR